MSDNDTPITLMTELRVTIDVAPVLRMLNVAREHLDLSDTDLAALLTRQGEVGRVSVRDIPTIRKLVPPAPVDRPRRVLLDKEGRQ